MLWIYAGSHVRCYLRMFMEIKELGRRTVDGTLVEGQVTCPHGHASISRVPSVRCPLSVMLDHYLDAAQYAPL